MPRGRTQSEWLVGILSPHVAEIVLARVAVLRQRDGIRLVARPAAPSSRSSLLRAFSSGIATTSYTRQMAFARAPRLQRRSVDSTSWRSSPGSKGRVACREFEAFVANSAHAWLCSLHSQKVPIA
jgi:hypothetical protein